MRPPWAAHTIASLRERRMALMKTDPYRIELRHTALSRCLPRA
jgi:putative hydrolase of the HAD superfamily